MIRLEIEKADCLGKQSALHYGSQIDITTNRVFVASFQSIVVFFQFVDSVRQYGYKILSVGVVGQKRVAKSRVYADYIFSLLKQWASCDALGNYYLEQHSVLQPSLMAYSVVCYPLISLMGWLVVPVMATLRHCAERQPNPTLTSGKSLKKNSGGIYA